MHIEELIEALGGKPTPRQAAILLGEHSHVRRWATERGLGRYMPPVPSLDATTAADLQHNATARYEQTLRARLQRSREREARRRTKAAAQADAARL